MGEFWNTVCAHQGISQATTFAHRARAESGESGLVTGISALEVLDHRFAVAQGRTPDGILTLVGHQAGELLPAGTGTR